MIFLRLSKRAIDNNCFYTVIGIPVIALHVLFVASLRCRQRPARSACAQCCLTDWRIQ